jgi:hypothetical protein
MQRVGRSLIWLAMAVVLVLVLLQIYVSGAW